MSYTNTITVDLSYAVAVERTKEALSEQGFGILSEIDVRSTFEKKLGAGAGDELGDYVIPGGLQPWPGAARSRRRAGFRDAVAMQCRRAPWQVCRYHSGPGH